VVVVAAMMLLEQVRARQSRTRGSSPDHGEQNRSEEVVAPFEPPIGRERNEQAHDRRKKVWGCSEQKTSSESAGKLEGGLRRTDVLVWDMPKVATTVGINEVTAAAVVLVT
jgi:hypothetical protein